jgi:hypothetical protein
MVTVVLLVTVMPPVWVTSYGVGGRPGGAVCGGAEAGQQPQGVASG